MVSRLLLSSSWHFHRRHPLQLLLSLIGIVLGVGIVTAVLLTNHSAVRAFALSSDSLYGNATHQIVAANGIKNSAAARFITSHPDIVIAPVIEGNVTINGTLATLVGLDVLREPEFGRIQPASFTDLDPDRIDTDSVLKARHPVWASEATAQRQTLSVGSTFLSADLEATIVGTFQTASRAASNGMLVTDISIASELLKREQKIDRLELIASDIKASKIEASLPPQWRIQATQRRQTTMQAMTRGFQINLTAMSLLALLVGMFLIHNTMTFSVLQRREVFAIKRMIGVSTNRLFAMILAEALALSLVASFLGLVCGVVIAQNLLQLTTQTINDLYFVLHVQQLHLSPIVLFIGCALGVGSSLVATLLAAQEAAQANTIQALRRSSIEERTSRLLPWVFALGAVSMLVGFVLATIPSQSLLLGFIALMVVVMGYGLCIPWLSQHLLGLALKLSRGTSVTLSYAVNALTSTMSRTGLAIAALSVAVSATLGVDIMIGSFRHSVDDWLGKTLRSDLYITLGETDPTGRSNPAIIEPQWLQQLSAIDGVDAISTGLATDVSTQVDTFQMLVLEPSAHSESSYEWMNATPDSAWSTFLNTPSVLISEPLANKHHLAAGATIDIFTELNGNVPFNIAGIYRDYGSSHGRLVMSRQHFRKYWTDERIGSIGVTLADSANTEQTIKTLQALAIDASIAANVLNNTTIHQESLAIFDRTFAVTRVLRWLTMGVAFIGIFSALLAMHLERSRDFAVLRASGGSRGQLQQIIGLQSLGMGLTAGLLALPLGWVMSELLIHIINVRSFGWSMGSHVPDGAIWNSLLLSIFAAVLAGIYPAWRLARRSIAHQLRAE